MILIAFYIAVVLCVILYEKDRVKNAKYYVILYILFVAIVSIRYRVGIDSLNYEDKFLNMGSTSVNSISESMGYELLWSYIYYWVNVQGGSFVIIQLIHAIIFNGLLFFFVRKVSIHPGYTILLFTILSFFYFETEILRESIAVAIMLCAIYYFCYGGINKRYLLYVALWVLAILFHTSSAFMLFVPLVFYLSNSQRALPRVVFPILLLILFYIPVTSNIITSFMPDSIESKISDYQIRQIGGNLMYLQVIQAVIAFVVYRLYFKNQKNSKYYNLINMGLYMYFIVSFAAIFKYGIFHRLENYFVVLYYLGIIELINSQVRGVSKRTIACLSMTVMLFLYGFTRSTGIGTLRYYNKYLPYTTILTNEEFSDREYFHVW